MIIGIFFLFAIILFLLYCLLTSGKKSDEVIAKFDRDRIVAHRDKRTKIEDTKYFSSTKNKEKNGYNE